MLLSLLAEGTKAMILGISIPLSSSLGWTETSARQEAPGQPVRPQTARRNGSTLPRWADDGGGFPLSADNAPIVVFQVRRMGDSCLWRYLSLFLAPNP